MQRRYRIQIEGTSPLIQDNPAKAIENILSPEHGRVGKTLGHKPDETWRFKVYPIGNGQLGHPASAIESALKDAALTFKAKGRGSMKTPIERTCFLDGEMAILTNIAERELSDQVQVFHSRNDQGQIVAGYFPCFAAGWRMEFMLTLTEDKIVSADKLKEILDYAGRYIGIGKNRPKYGRFMVTSFQEVDGLQAVAAD
jgi:hypothetical protein